LDARELAVVFPVDACDPRFDAFEAGIEFRFDDALHRGDAVIVVLHGFSDGISMCSSKACTTRSAASSEILADFSALNNETRMTFLLCLDDARDQVGRAGWCQGPRSGRVSGGRGNDFPAGKMVGPCRP
jgi:hypothetical protein